MTEYGWRMAVSSLSDDISAMMGITYGPRINRITVSTTKTLQSAVAGVMGLLGTTAENGSAAVAWRVPRVWQRLPRTTQVAGFRPNLSAQMSGMFTFEGAAGWKACPTCSACSGPRHKRLPSAAFETFTQRLTQANSVFAGDLLQRLQDTLDAIQSISHGVPENRTAVVGALLDQILNVLGSLEGPEAEQIRSWFQSLQELHQVLMPLIEQAQAAPDPAAYRATGSAALAQQHPGGVRLRTGARFARLPRRLSRGQRLSAEMLTGMSTALTATATPFGQLQSVVKVLPAIPRYGRGGG